MTRSEIMALIESMVEEASVAILATVDSDCAPRIRWMTPGCIRQRPGAIFMVSGSQMAKVDQIRENPRAQMIFQNRYLDKVITATGKINLLSNPSIRAETLECIGKHLHTFWKINQPDSELIVLEFIVEEATLYIPHKGDTVTVNFMEEV